MPTARQTSNAREQSKAWVFTINNYTREQYEYLLDSTGHNYLLFSPETGEKGTPHLQGYVQTPARSTRATIFNSFGFRNFWIEPARGKFHHQDDYIKKKPTHVTWCPGPSVNTCCPRECGKVIELGTPRRSEQGRRTDLESVKSFIDEHLMAKDLEETIMDEFFPIWVRYRSSLHNYIRTKRALAIPADRGAIEVIIHYGKTGAGKSRAVKEAYPDAYWVMRPRGQGQLWWTGYNLEQTVIFDDFYGWCPIDFILRLCDRYPLLLPVHGGVTKCNVRRVVFTSNVHPDEWWTKVPDAVRAAFSRRITTLHPYL